MACSPKNAEKTIKKVCTDITEMAAHCARLHSLRILARIFQHGIEE